MEVFDSYLYLVDEKKQLYMVVMLTTHLDADVAEELLLELRDSAEPHETALRQLAEVSSWKERQLLRGMYIRLDTARSSSPEKSYLLEIWCKSGEVVEIEFPALRPGVSASPAAGFPAQDQTLEDAAAVPTKPAPLPHSGSPIPGGASARNDFPVPPSMPSSHATPLRSSRQADQPSPPSLALSPLPSSAASVMCTPVERATKKEELATTHFKRGRSSSAFLLSPPSRGPQLMSASSSETHMRVRRSSRALMLEKDYDSEL